VTNYSPLHTTKTWAESLNDLVEEFRKWGINDYLLPIRKRAMLDGKVVLSFAVNGRWIEPPIECSIGPSKFSMYDPDTSLRAIVLAIESARKADQRGIGALLAAATAHLALPAYSAYRVLGVPEGTRDPKILRAAYVEKAKLTHPDRGGNVAEFQAMQKAAEELGVS